DPPVGEHVVDGHPGQAAAGRQVASRPAPAAAAASTYPVASSERSSAWSRVALKSPARTRAGPPGSAGGTSASEARQSAIASAETGGTGCGTATSTGAAPGTSSAAQGIAKNPPSARSSSIRSNGWAENRAPPTGPGAA